jgi:Secretion system C-terminal sorting domain
VYPNPAQDEVNIAVNGNAGAHGYVAVEDALGRTLISVACSQPGTTIDVRSLMNGIYTVSYRQANGGSLHTKLLIMR